MSGIIASVTDNEKLGYYRVYAQAPGSDQKVEITFFRGAPLSITSLSTSDPFGDKSSSITVHNVTIYDRIGEGDLEWLAPWSKIDVVWEPDSSLDSVTASLMSDWSWEGVIASWQFKQDSSTGALTIECVGALYILDNMLAMPFYPTRPVPFEILIERIFRRADEYQYGVKLNPIIPDPNECMTYQSKNYQFGIQNPISLSEGQLWSGFATKASGDKSKALTGFIAGLLSQMYSTTGKQWTLMNEKGRLASLKVREYRDDTFIDSHPSSYDVLYIDAVTPGVNISLNQDYSQSANVVYGSGTTPEGRKFSSPNGNKVKKPQIINTTLDYLYYEQNPQPFAIQDSVEDLNNSSHKKTVRKEVNIDFQAGVSALQAVDVAKRKLDIVKDPGYSGTITLAVDPKTKSGFVYPRYLIEAGKTIVLQYGTGDTYRRFIFNISDATLNIEAGTVDLTVDTKFRDLITVEEVRARRGDALNMVRRLSTQAVQSDIPQIDYLRPWDGVRSGKMPKTTESLTLFDEIDFKGSSFPWTDVTVKYPPKNNKKMYVELGATNAKKPKGNWVGPIKVQLSAIGSVGLTQIAAYDKDGNLFPAEFHVSFYLSPTVSADAMPKIITRIQNFQTKKVASAKWYAKKGSVSYPGYTGTGGWVEYTFTKPHGIPSGSLYWTLSPGSVTGNWVPAAGASISITDVDKVRFYKSSKPTGVSPTAGFPIFQKQTFPRQRASLGTNSTNVKSNYSQYTITWDASLSQYKVSIFIGQEEIKAVGAKIKAAVKNKASFEDSISNNNNVNITVTGSSLNPSINGSFETVASEIGGTLDYYINATDVVSGTQFNDPVTVEIDVAATGIDPGNYNGGPYPFYEWAWQSSFSDGTSFENAENSADFASTAPQQSYGFTMGWGSYWQPAGYGSGLASQGAPKTGTLIDENPWSYDTTKSEIQTWLDAQDVPSAISNADGLGFVYAMIYCDDQGADNIYFLGRLWPNGGGGI